jgi:hypothetical protein
MALSFFLKSGIVFQLDGGPGTRAVKSLTGLFHRQLGTRSESSRDDWCQIFSERNFRIV